jgi:hypothetical protein
MHADFSAARREAQGEPTTFSIDGETFTVDTLPAAAVFDLAQLATADEQELLESTLAFRRFLEAVVVPDDLERFQKTLREKRVSFDTLGEIVRWLVTSGTGRPTSPPLESPAQPQTNGRTSKDSSSAPDTLPEPSY